MDDLIRLMGLTGSAEPLFQLLFFGQNWLYADFDEEGRVCSCSRMLNGKSVLGLRVDQVIDLPGDIALPMARIAVAEAAVPLIVRWQADGELYESLAVRRVGGCSLLGHRFLLSDEPFLGTSLMMETFDLRKTIEERDHEINRLGGQISQLMGSDPLTGLANESRFVNVLETEIKVAVRHETPLSLICCDLDYFRSINETFGREVGDAVLVRLADVLRRFLRQEDLAARYRSVTFFVLLPRTTLDSAYTLAERVRLYLPTVQLESEKEKPLKNLSASFSVCQYRTGESASEFLSRSGGALSEAKSHGRNCTVSVD